MGDWIDELVDWQLERGPVCGWEGMCPNACGLPWHSWASTNCPGSWKKKVTEIVRHADHISWQVNFGV